MIYTLVNFSFVQPAPTYTCPTSFKFYSINPATSMSRQAAISNVKATLSGGIEVNLGTLWFKAPTELANGLSESDLIKHATRSLNVAESAMRNAANNGETNPSVLGNIWRTYAADKFYDPGTYLINSSMIDPSYLISSQSLIPEQSNVQIQPHQSCN